MKNCGRIAVDSIPGEAPLASIPVKLKFRLNKKFLSITASAFLCWTSLGLSQSVKAEDAFTVADIKSTLGGSSQAVSSEQFGQPHRQYADDQALSALQDFAQRLGTAQPQAIENLPKVAEVGSLLEFLQQRGSSTEKATAPATAKQKYKAAPEATFVDSKVCATCHAPLVAEFEKTLMGRIGKTQKGKFDCQNCHGPGSAHVKAGGGRGVGGILSFGATDPRSAEEKNAICVACHQRGNRTNWAGSTHQTRGLACTDCHTVMKNASRKHNLKTAFEPDTCFQCHKDRRAQMFRSSHMPLREGKIVCSNCHNPHGSFTEALLKKDSINDTCYTCHAEKRGPFLFEHLPVRENCDNCHEPHGSVNEASLKMSRPRLCLECHNADHAQFVGPNKAATMASACQNCHTQVHGSNSPAGAKLQR